MNCRSTGGIDDFAFCYLIYLNNRMPKLPASQTAPVLPSPEQAAVALRQIRKDWGLDWSDLGVILGVAADGVTDIAWRDELLLRVAYLMELDKALLDLQPRAGIASWLARPNPGPFFGGDSPLQRISGSTQGLVELLEQVRRWNRERH